MEPENWWKNPEVEKIERLRCDGFVEVCFEMNGVMVWGKKSKNGGYNYDITASQQNEDEHNAGEASEIKWGKYLFPATQCGHESKYRYTHWNTKMFRKNPYNLKPYEPILP